MPKFCADVHLECELVNSTINHDLTAAQINTNSLILVLPSSVFLVLVAYSEGMVQVARS